MIDNRIKLEEVKIENKDILIIEGTIHKEKIRIILTYMDCCKETRGPNYNANRVIQKEIEKFLAVDPGVRLVCLGDFNGRMKVLG